MAFDSEGDGYFEDWVEDYVGLDRDYNLFPDLVVLQQMKKLDIPITISTDAHKPDEVALMTDVAAHRIAEAGYTEVNIFENNAWRGIPLD